MFPRTLLTCALAFSSGCSLAFVKGPPDFIPPEEPVPAGACTIERVLPILDAVGAGTYVIAALSSSEGDVVRIGAVLGGALGFSSYTGFRRVGQCRERMFQGPGGLVPDTALAWPLDGIASPLFAGPLLADPLFTRFPPQRK